MQKAAGETVSAIWPWLISDTDECDAEHFPCAEKAHCVNNEGDFECVCPEGSCVLSKPAVGDHLELVSYVQLFDSCSQDSFAVYAILVDLLKNVKAVKPQITGALLRSDRVGCYHSNTLIAPLQSHLWVIRHKAVEVNYISFLSVRLHNLSSCWF